MSQVIKSSVANTLLVQSFGKADAPLPAAKFEPEVIFEARISELTAELASRDEALAELLQAARAEGAKDALKQRSDAEECALKELKSALTAAREIWKESLGSAESLAIGLARAVLAKVFADADRRSEQVASCIKHRLQLLEAGSVVRIRISNDDFSSEQLRALASELGSALEINADSKLKSGSCVVDLKLGQVEVSPNAQWQRISELLDQLERESRKS
jgi:flagellar biosynthesis/type III secretory pathway protein FliH